MLNLKDRLLNDHTTLDQEDAQQLRHGLSDQYTIEVLPPRGGDLPATLTRFVKGITEYQTRWLGLLNASPVTAYEIRRDRHGDLTYQFTVPTKRLERKIRTNLVEEIPDVSFREGSDGLPVQTDDSIGGGLLYLGRGDWYPLRIKYDHPPINSLTAALHRHAMQGTRVIIQTLFQPWIGHPVRNRLWIRRTYKQIGYLRKQKPDVLPWHDRPATPREKRQADAIEEKAGNPRFQVSIRFLVIGAGEHTPSRVKELAGAFNVFEDGTTGQYLNMETIQPYQETRFIDYANAVQRREFDGWSLAFQASQQELAALVSIPDRNQKNISYSQP